MAPRRAKDVPIMHNNGAMQTVFAANASPEKCRGTTGARKARKDLKVTVTEPSDSDSHHILASEETPKRKCGRKAQSARTAAASRALELKPSSEARNSSPPSSGLPILDQQENPFLSAVTINNHVDNRASTNDSEASDCASQEYHLHAVAIPSSQTPHAGQHSPNRASPEAGAAQKKNRKAAQDVLVFFSVENNHQFCKFCIRDNESLQRCDSYKTSSATSTLQRHLYNKHLVEWVEGCKQAGIKITASEPGVQDALDEYHRHHSTDSHNAASDRDTPSLLYQDYSPEAFVDAIVDWIVADDQIGWATLDNASNNKTMMDSLETLLMARGIDFLNVDQRIRCFPHIVNLAVQAVLALVTNIKYAQDDS
ncbi:hypothetical protein CPC08DRAFT_770216 [Agrocybe pediades]|nr:hypothetical protein CPC08DRAFT_770216 [Agrocybe pediades]